MQGAGGHCRSNACDHPRGSQPRAGDSSRLDESSVDPREELSFQAELIEFSHLLRQEGGGVAKAWKPGAPPDEWTRG